MNKKRKILAFILFLCWVPQIVYLSPVPTMKVAEQLSLFASKSLTESPEILEKGILDKDEYATKQIYRNLWFSWLFKASILFFGLFSAIITFMNFRGWPLSTVSSSALYLSTWYSTGSTASVSIFESYKLKFELAQHYNLYRTFLYKDVLLPSVFILVITYLSVKFLRNYRDS